MRKFPRCETVRVRVVLVDFLKQQMLELEALRKKVADAERRCKARHRHVLGIIEPPIEARAVALDMNAEIAVC
jgi:hypothetical protein